MVKPILGESRNISNQERKRLDTYIVSIKDGTLDGPLLQAMIKDIIEIFGI